MPKIYSKWEAGAGSILMVFGAMIVLWPDNTDGRHLIGYILTGGSIVLIGAAAVLDALRK